MNDRISEVRKTYVVCSSQRSGSSLFCHLLRQTAVLGRPGGSGSLRALKWSLFEYIKKTCINDAQAEVNKVLELMQESSNKQISIERAKTKKQGGDLNLGWRKRFLSEFLELKLLGC